jgi:hypothetical protein
MKLIAELVIPGNSGSTKLQTMFVSARVDKYFQEFVDNHLGPMWSSKGFPCAIYEKKPDTDLGLLALNCLQIDSSEEANKLLALLRYLATEGNFLLNIPKREEEVNFVLGYVKEEDLVLFIEHEQEDGKEEEYHLHACSPLRLRGDQAFVAIFNK